MPQGKKIEGKKATPSAETIATKRQRGIKKGSDKKKEEPRRTKIDVRFNLTDSERLDYGNMLAQALQAVSEVKERLAEIGKQMKADIGTHEANINKFKTLLANGYEYRSVTVTVHKNYEANKVEYRSIEDGSIILRERAMTAEDRQEELF